MTYGLTDTGFLLKRLPDIKQEIDTEVKVVLGGVDVSTDEPIGQIIGIFTRHIADCWEQLAATYNSFSVLSAKRVSLDRLIATNNLFRIQATKTKVAVQLIGDEDTVAPTNFIVSETTNNKLFVLKDPTTISRHSVSKITLEVTSAEDGQCAITINGREVAMVVSSTTVSGIAAYLVGVINSTHADIALAEDIGSGVFSISTLLPFDALDVDIRADSVIRIVIDEIQTPGVFYAAESGKILALSGTVTEIETPITGIDTVSNLFDGEVGSVEETDDAFRYRRARSLKVVGSGNLEAIAARLLDLVQGVTSVLAYDNATDTVDGEGRPAHSIELVVSGGVDSEIANAIWSNLSTGGIATYGNVSVGITDSQGYLQTICFSRPVVRYAHIRVTVVSYYDEEQFPDDGVTHIRESVLDFLNGLQVGNDIILQRIVGPIYTNVAGVSELLIEGALTNTPTGTPSWGEANLPLGQNQLADFDSTRITVILP